MSEKVEKLQKKLKKAIAKGGGAEIIAALRKKLAKKQVKLGIASSSDDAASPTEMSKEDIAKAVSNFIATSKAAAIGAASPPPSPALAKEKKQPKEKKQKKEKKKKREKDQATGRDKSTAKRRKIDADCASSDPTEKDLKRARKEEKKDKKVQKKPQEDEEPRTRKPDEVETAAYAAVAVAAAGGKGSADARADGGAGADGAMSAVSKKLWPKQTGDITILLFYTYVRPVWTTAEQDEAIDFIYKTLNELGVTGRCRVAREGLNSTLSGTKDAIRKFTAALREYNPQHFGKTDFKYVDDLPQRQLMPELKVFPVSELVTYGFNAAVGRLEGGGKHLSPEDYHKQMSHPNTIMIDVRNFNETAIGKFAPPGVTVLDPCMRRSTEFPGWVKRNASMLKDKKVLMYCTGGIRCERASAFLTEAGVEDVNQLEGGIHRYLEKYPKDGGHWVGQNYTFDKRFSHGAEDAEVVAKCVACNEPWERYQAGYKCGGCSMEVLICKSCQFKKKEIKEMKRNGKLLCGLCVQGKHVFHIKGVQRGKPNPAGGKVELGEEVYG